MAKKTDRQEAHALINYFLKKYKESYGQQPPGLNRYALAFGFEALHQDYGAEATDIIDYYFKSYEGHSPKFFVSKYGDIALQRQYDLEDLAEREAIYRETVKMVREKRRESK